VFVFKIANTFSNKHLYINYYLDRLELSCFLAFSCIDFRS